MPWRVQKTCEHQWERDISEQLEIEQIILKI
jgi:hypothetical protein